MRFNFQSFSVSFNKKNIKAAISVLILYLFFLIISIPANVLLSNLNLPKNVIINSVSGTVWSGNIDQLQVSNIYLGRVSWSLSPLNLLIGELSADFAIINDEQFINSKVNVSSSGKIELEETRFSIDLSTLAPLTYGMPFAYSGKASGYFPVTFFLKNNFVGINGKLSLANIKMISPQEQAFGNFTVDFRAEKEGATSGKIKGMGGNLDISGVLNLNKKGQFNISAKLAARESDAALEQILSFLGKKDASGRVEINSSIKLWN